MDFKPFDAPPSDHHPLNSGLGTENGVTAKGLIEGINTYLAHLFAAVEGKVETVASEAKAISRAPDKVISSLTANVIDFGTRLEAVEDSMVDLKKLVQEVRPMLEAFLAVAHGTQQAADPNIDPTKLVQTADGVQVDAQPAVGAPPRNKLADMLAGISGK